MGPYGHRFFRGDIQGLRGVSAVVIMFYHIWFNKISGGVDVFFVISGFLITVTLLRELDRTKAIQSISFLSRMSARILPTALAVILFTMAATLILVPPPMWKFGLNDMIASVLQVENWELFRTSVNYLNRDDPPSQFQQFWALSIQFQFYFFIALVFKLIVPIIVRMNSHLVAVIFFLAVAASSLIWSIDFTMASPERAYFSTFTRLWEFSFGSLLAFAYPYIRQQPIPRSVASFGYHLSFVVFLLFGLVVPTTVAFPGAIAAIPVMCAVVFIAAGEAIDSRTRLFAALESAPMQVLGRLSFSVYLWHWPLLIFAQHQLQTTRLGIAPGLAVIALALVLSLLTHRYVELPALRHLRSGSAAKSLLVGVTAVAIVAGVGLATRQWLTHLAAVDRTADLPSLQDREISAAMVSERPGFRRFVLSNFDRPAAIEDCLRRECVFGDPEAQFTVAVINGSHSAQWVTVLDHAGKRHGFKVVTAPWIHRPVDIPETLDADVVVTTSTATEPLRIGDTSKHPQERSTLPDDIELSAWGGSGYPVIAIRDNPRFVQYQNACVWQNPGAQERCSLDRASVFQAHEPVPTPEPNVDWLHPVDLSNLLCTASTCPAVVDGILVYYDRHHLSETYLRYIADAAIAEIERQAPGVLPGPK